MEEIETDFKKIIIAIGKIITSNFDSQEKIAQIIRLLIAAEVITDFID